MMRIVEPGAIPGRSAFGTRMGGGNRERLAREEQAALRHADLHVFVQAAEGQTEGAGPGKMDPLVEAKGHPFPHLTKRVQGDSVLPGHT